MKIRWNGPTSVGVIANPSERILAATRADILAAYHAEALAFVEDVAVTLRRLAPGESVTVQSRPIEVTLSRTLDDAPPKGEGGESDGK